MAKQPTGVWGIDLRKDCICMAQYSPEDNSVAPIIINPVAQTNSDWWQTLSDEFRSLIRKIQFGARDVACALPGDGAIIKEVLLDNDEENVAEAIEWEISQQVIGSLGDYVFDYQPLVKGADPSVARYLAVAYRNAVVDRTLALMKSAKISPFIIDLDIFALVNVFEANYKEQTGAPNFIVYGEGELLTIVLTLNGQLVDIETLPAGQHLPADAIAELIRKGMSTILSIHGGLLTQESAGVYLTGSLFYLNDTAAGVAAVVPKAEVLYPFRSIACRADMSEEDLKKHAPQLAIAVGLAVRGGSEIST